MRAMRRDGTDQTHVPGNRASTAGDAESRRRARGKFGPFSGGHLTAIIVTVVIVVGFPFAAGAVTGNNVFVTDAASGTRATVTSKGQLSAAVTGSVTATPAAPTNLVFSHQTINTPGSACLFLTPKPGKAMVITGITYNMAKASAASEMQVILQVNPTSSCGIGTEIENDFFPSDTPYSEDLSPGIAVANGHSLDAFASGGPAGAFAQFTIHGYYVPASQCSTGCL